MDLFDEIMNRGPGFYPISGKALLKIHKKAAAYMLSYNYIFR